MVKIYKKYQMQTNFHLLGSVVIFMKLFAGKPECWSTAGKKAEEVSVFL